MPDREPRRPPITVQVHEHDSPPIDLDAWADNYVKNMLHAIATDPLETDETRAYAAELLRGYGSMNSLDGRR